MPDENETPAPVSEPVADSADADTAPPEAAETPDAAPAEIEARDLAPGEKLAESELPEDLAEKLGSLHEHLKASLTTVTLPPEAPTLPADEGPSEDSRGPFAGRIHSLAVRTGVDYNDLLGAGSELATAHPELMPMEVVEILERSTAAAQPKLGAVEIRDLATQMAKLASQSTLVVTHGTYHGDGCPDPRKRKFKSDSGFAYDAHHPASPGELVVGLELPEAKRLVATGCFKFVDG